MHIMLMLVELLLFLTDRNVLKQTDAYICGFSR